MPLCYHVTDLHGHEHRYRRLFAEIAAGRPRAVFVGGDLLPHGFADTGEDGPFLEEVFRRGFEELRETLRDAYPDVFVILGNDDPRIEEERLADGEADGLWLHLHGRRAVFAGRAVYGYACVPPTPFLLKDWERYDVGPYVGPGCVSPEEGTRTVPMEPREVRRSTMWRELQDLASDDDLAGAIVLFHSPPVDCELDRAALDGRMVDHVPMDLHVGSVAVRRFIETRQPRVTLHGHVHESARLTGAWHQRIGSTWCYSAAHDGPELALVRFDPDRPEDAVRDLL